MTGRGAHDNWDSSSHDMPPAPHRRPAPVRDEKETLSTGRGKKKRTSVVSKSWDAEVRRLTDGELRSIPRSLEEPPTQQAVDGWRA